MIARPRFLACVIALLFSLGAAVAYAPASPQGAPQASPEDCATLQAAAQLFRKYDEPQADSVHIHLVALRAPEDIHMFGRALGCP